MSCYYESKYLDRFFEILRTTDDKVCYGQKTVQYVLEQRAVETLLISDHLFRSRNIEMRKLYVKMAESAESSGIKVIIFGSMNPTGERLKQMTGVAAILLYALPGLDDIGAEEYDIDSDEQD